jgi:hypothetical protein
VNSNRSLERNGYAERVKPAGREPGGSFQAGILSADLDRSNPPAVAGMHAATDNMAAAVVVVVVIVSVGMVSVVVAVGSEAKPYKRTSVKSSTMEVIACETSMKAGAAEAPTTAKHTPRY